MKRARKNPRLNRLSAATQTRKLLEIAKDPSITSGNLPEALRKITEMVAKTTQVERVSIWRFEGLNSRIRCLNLYERSRGAHSCDALLSAAKYPRYFRALEKNRTISANNAHTHPATREFSKTYLTPLGIRSMLDAPIRLGGDVLGVVCHEHVNSFRRWTIEEIAFAGSIADFVALAIERWELKVAEKKLRESERRYRELMNEKLRASDERYHTLTESAPDGIIACDAKGSITYANPKALSLFGFTQGDVLGQPLSILMPGKYAPFHARAFERASADVAPPSRGRTMEVQGKAKDGREFPIEITISGYRSGRHANFMAIVRDITPRKDAERDLRLYKEIFANSQDGIAILNTDGTFREQNAAHTSLLGYSDQDFAGKTPALHLGELEFAKIVTAMEKTGMFRGEIVSKAKDGHTVNIDLAAFAVLDDQKRPTCIVGSKRDISSKIRIEEALRASEIRFRQLAENIEDVFWIRDANEPKILYVSPAFEKVWGRKPQDLYDDRSIFLTSLHPDDRERVSKESNDLHKKSAHQQYRIIRPDGTMRWIRDRAFPVRDDAGNVYRIAGIAEDITQEKQLEEEMRLLARITSRSAEAIFSLDSTGKCIFWNRTAEKLFGFSAEEIIGKNPRDLIIPPDMQDELDKFLALYQANPAETVVGWRTVRVHKNGTRIPILKTSFPLLDDQGVPTGRAVIYQDLTKIVQMEERLLEHSKMAAIGQMSAAIAHEIRNPLFGISSVAQILAREQESDPEFRELADQMLSEIRRLEKLVDDLLRYARPRKLDLLNVSASEICEKTSELVRPVAEEKSVTITHCFNGCETAIRVDERQIKQVLLNMYLNAIQASEAGGVIEVTSQVVESQKPLWTFQIHNRGAWIGPNEILHVFEPFFSTRDDGTGLGLAVSRKIVEDHGGTISVKSSEAEGTLFTLSMPNVATLTPTIKPSMNEANR